MLKRPKFRLMMVDLFNIIHTLSVMEQQDDTGPNFQPLSLTTAAKWKVLGRRESERIDGELKEGEE